MREMVRARKAIEKLYRDTCAVYIKGKDKDKITGETIFIESPLFESQPCKLSIEKVSPTLPVENVSQVKLSVKLFISPDLGIPAGSKIVVTRNGVSYEYKRSGESPPFTNHQEIPLEPFDRWA